LEALRKEHHIFFSNFFFGGRSKRGSGGNRFWGKGFEVSKSHNEDKVFREPVDTPFKKELLQLSCALQLRKIIIDHSEERRNFVLYFWEKKFGA